MTLTILGSQNHLGQRECSCFLSRELNALTWAQLSQPQLRQQQVMLPQGFLLLQLWCDEFWLLWGLLHPQKLQCHLLLRYLLRLLWRWSRVEERAFWALPRQRQRSLLDQLLQCFSREQCRDFLGFSPRGFPSG
jgi:hypothetical protein